MGMKFGLWFEPEMVSEDSDLYRAHPDWAVKIPGRKPNLSRHQMILDFSRKDVQDYILERLCSVLASAPISYVKWDFNRSICDKYSTSLPAEKQGEMAHRFMLGLYRVLDGMLSAYPHLLLEGCSGGGGRFDAGMLYYSPQIWCSDDTDAIERLQIQYGTSFGYPVSTMGAHVSAVPNHQTGRVTPLATRGCVAMAAGQSGELIVDFVYRAGAEDDLQLTLGLKDALGPLGVLEGLFVHLAVVLNDQAQAGCAVGCRYDVGRAADGIQYLLCRVFVIHENRSFYKM